MKFYGLAPAVHSLENTLHIYWFPVNVFLIIEIYYTIVFDLSQ